MSNFNSINNGGVPYYFPADIAKEGQQYARFSNWLKTRVNDNGKKVPVKWYDQGRVMNVNGLTPFIQGMVGHFTTDENDELIPSSDVVSRDWQGSTADVTDGGLAFYTLEDQFFCQEGQFKGVFGLRDSNGNVYTSVNIVFEILGNDLRMGETTKYYSSKLDKMVQEFQVRTDEVINDAKASYTNETQTVREALASAQGAIQTTIDTQQGLSTRLAGMQQQIATNDIITRPEFLNLSNQLTQQVAQMKENGLEFFNNLNELKAKYPQGANKLCVTLDNSHQWIYDYAHGGWNDAGGYNFGEIDPKLKKSIYQSNPNNLILNSDFNSMDLWNAARVDGSAPNCYINQTTDNMSNSLVINGFIKDGTSNESWVKTDPIPVSNHTTLSIGADLKVQGVNTRVGDSAGIDVTWTNKDGNNFYFSHFRAVPSNDGDFRKILLENIPIPSAATTFQITFYIYGEGSIEVLRPHANFGKNLLNYAGQDDRLNLEEWQPSTDGSTYIVHNEVTKLVGDNDTHNYAYLSSPIFWINSQQDSFNIKLNAQAQWSSGHGEAYLEVREYDEPSSSQIASGLNTGNVQQYKIYPSDDFFDYNFNGIKVSPTTVAVVIRLVIHGNVTLSMKSVDFKIYSIKDRATSLLTNKTGNIEDVTSIVDGMYNINTLSNTTNQYHFSMSNFIEKKYDKIDVSLTAKTTLKNVEALAPSQVYLEIDQYLDQTVQNTSMQITKEIKPTDSVCNFVFKNIKLDPDTKFFTIGLTVYNNADVSFSDIEFAPSVHDENETDPTITLTGFDIMPPAEYDPQTGIATLPQSAKPDQWIMADTKCFRVVPGSVVSFKALAKAQVENQSNAVIEINQYSSLTEPIDSSLNVDLHLTQTKELAEFSMENIKLADTTNFISFRLAFPGNGNIELKKIEVWNLDHIHNFSSNQNAPVLPQLNIQSNAEITDSWVTAPFKYQDGQRRLSGYLQFAIQGDSSRMWPKKNLKLKFFKDAACQDKLKWRPKADWDLNHKFNVKANWIDATQARNLTNAKLFAKAIADTPIMHESQKPLLKTQNLGEMEGFPIELYFNNTYYGLMTFNTKKDDKTFGMDSDNSKHEVISSTNYANPWGGDPNATIDGKVYATEIHDQATPTLKDNFSKFLNFINTSSDTDFKAQVTNYIDLNAVFNCMLFGILSKMEDSLGKSILLLTWNDGTSFYPILYDLDSTWDLKFNGQSNAGNKDWSLDTSAPGKYITGIGVNKLYERVYKLFKPELKARYQALRSTVWQNSQITSAYKEFIRAIPYEAYEREQARWSDIPSKSFTDFAQIQQSIIERGNAMDKLMEGLQ